MESPPAGKDPPPSRIETVRIFVMADEPYVSAIPKDRLRRSLNIEGVEYRQARVTNDVAGPWIIYSRRDVDGAEAQKAVAEIRRPAPHCSRALFRCVMGPLDGQWWGDVDGGRLQVDTADGRAAYNLAHNASNPSLYLFDDGQKGEWLSGG